jgi:hypothetical protein
MRDAPPAVEKIKVGLRFGAAEAPLLRNIADQLRAERRPFTDISLFDKAAESAEQDEPLIVVCSSPLEAERIAHGFTRWGIERPAIDELNG